MSTFMDDAIDILTRINDATIAAMPSVGEEIKSCIADHIASEVYNYDSSVYPRSYTLLKGASNADVNIVGASVSVSYEPDGSRPGTFGELPKDVREKYNKSDTDLIKPNPLFGDAFINRIEKGTYDYKGARKVGARPFLKHAVEELIEGKRALNAFISAFNGADAGLKMVDKGDAEIFRTGDDWS